MTPEFKKKWISALRSNEYKQYHGGWADNFDNPTQFCCVGVALKETGEWDEWVAISRKDPEYGGAWQAAIDLLKILDDWVFTTLITMNDHEEKSFSEIADWIESQEIL